MYTWQAHTDWCTKIFSAAEEVRRPLVETYALKSASVLLTLQLRACSLVCFSIFSPREIVLPRKLPSTLCLLARKGLSPTLVSSGLSPKGFLKEFSSFLVKNVDFASLKIFKYNYTLILSTYLHITYVQKNWILRFCVRRVPIKSSFSLWLTKKNVFCLRIRWPVLINTYLLWQFSLFCLETVSPDKTARRLCPRDGQAGPFFVFFLCYFALAICVPLCHRPLICVKCGIFCCTPHFGEFFSCGSVCIGATVADNWSEISQNGSNGPKMKMSLLLKGSQHLRGGGVDCSWSSFGPVWLVETLVDPPGGTLTGLSSEKKMCFQWLAWSAENFLTPKTGQKRPILAIFGFFATKAAKKTPQKFISTSACSTKRKFSSNQVDPWTPDWRRGLYLASGFFPMSTASHWTLTHDFSNNLVFANCINIRDFSEILHISAKYQRQSQSFIFLYIL